MENNGKKRLSVFIVIALFAIFGILNSFFSTDENDTDENTENIPYSEFMSLINNGDIDYVKIDGSVLFGKSLASEGKILQIDNSDTQTVGVDITEPALIITNTNTQFKTIAPNDPSLIKYLLDKQVEVVVSPPLDESNGILLNTFFSFGPVVLLLIVLITYFAIASKNSKGNGRMNPFSFGKNKAKVIKPEDNKVLWDDIKGIDEAKFELKEVVDFLKKPSKFRNLGGKIPKGVLLIGSPGCGKTHLSRALAHEAGANFLALSGSDFVEMFVGVGASRVRDLFEEARKNTPSIIFIDEIDAVGRQRGAGVGIGNDEREQTLNALLVEMDGFDQSGGVIVIAATNRPDVLDSALLRPGRFDRQVIIPMPDINGRKEILDVYIKNISLGDDVKTEVLARATPGFSGADLSNLVNEAALFAARENKKVVSMSDFESAKDKITMGTERKILSMTEEDRRNTAYHESGHAIVSLALNKTDPVHKVTIVPRGMALGVTMMIPEREQYGHDREQLKQQIVVLMGGRVAEELFLGQMSTGASDDIRKATELARKMVTTLGMSPTLGAVRYANDDASNASFLGKTISQSSRPQWSEETQRLVDEEIVQFIQNGYNTARVILIDCKEEIKEMANMLLKQETISADDCLRIMGKKKDSWKCKKTPISEI